MANAQSSPIAMSAKRGRRSAGRSFVFSDGSSGIGVTVVRKERVAGTSAPPTIRRPDPTASKWPLPATPLTLVTPATFRHHCNHPRDHYWTAQRFPGPKLTPPALRSTPQDDVFHTDPGE